MAEVTVIQLAKTVGTTVDRLLSQMKDAGLDHESSEQLVSDEDKKKLLTHLKNAICEHHGMSVQGSMVGLNHCDVLSMSTNSEQDANEEKRSA